MGVRAARPCSGVCEGCSEALVLGLTCAAWCQQVTFDWLADLGRVDCGVNYSGRPSSRHRTSPEADLRPVGARRSLSALEKACRPCSPITFCGRRHKDGWPPAGSLSCPRLGPVALPSGGHAGDERDDQGQQLDQRADEDPDLRRIAQLLSRLVREDAADEEEERHDRPDDRRPTPAGRQGRPGLRRPAG
jgi:hypothetical protein